ncbi:MAG: hypothetical protein HY319_24710 [Armatimonadetes bacterium]|nr:hypothetical protein [Armatimonadota bacterium]
MTEVVEGGGKALIPAFALGRAQEVILILLEAQRNGTIPRFPIHVDGMGKRVCAIYSAYGDFMARPLRQKVEREGNPFFGEGSAAVQVLPPRRQEVADGPPCAIVSSSGMLTGGPSVFYAAALAADQRNAILITGYQDEESPGRAVQELARQGAGSLRLNGRPHRLGRAAQLPGPSGGHRGGGRGGSAGGLAPREAAVRLRAGAADPGPGAVRGARRARPPAGSRESLPQAHRLSPGSGGGIRHAHRLSHLHE